MQLIATLENKFGLIPGTRAYGDKKMYGKSFMGIIRSSFLIDEARQIKGAWHKIKPENTLPEASKARGSVAVLIERLIVFYFPPFEV